MNKDDPLPLTARIFLHHGVETVHLIAQHVARRHACSVVQQLTDVQVHLHDFVLLPLGLRCRRLRPPTVLARLGHHGLLQLGHRDQERPFRHIVAHDGHHDRPLVEVVVRCKAVQLVKLHRVQPQLHRDGVLQPERTPPLEGDQLHAEPLQIGELLLAKLLEEDPRVWLHRPPGAERPAAVRGRHITIGKLVIALVDQVRLIATLDQVLRVDRQVGQAHVQALAVRRLFRTIGRRPRLSRLRPRRLRHRRSRCTARRWSLPVVHHDAFTHEHGVVETIFVLHHHRLLILQSLHHAPTHTVEEAHLVTYFYSVHNLDREIVRRKGRLFARATQTVPVKALSTTRKVPSGDKFGLPEVQKAPSLHPMPLPSCRYVPTAGLSALSSFI